MPFQIFIRFFSAVFGCSFFDSAVLFEFLSKSYILWPLKTSFLSDGTLYSYEINFIYIQVCKFQVGSYSYNMEKMIFAVTQLGYAHTSRYVLF